MSSILDALNKAEQERAAAEDALARGFDVVDAEDELVGRASQNGVHKRGVPLAPLKMILLGIAFLWIIAAVSGGVALLVLNLGDTSAQVHLSADSASVDPIEQNPAPITPAEPGVQTAQRPVFLDTPAATDEAHKPESGSAASETLSVASLPGADTPSVPEPVSSGSLEVLPATPKPKEVSEPSAASGWSETPVFRGTPEVPAARPAEPTEESGWSEPAPRVQTARTEPRPAYAAQEAEPSRETVQNDRTSATEYADSSRALPVASPPADSGESRPGSRRVIEDEVDILSLPELTVSDKARLGLPDITVNVVGRPSRYRPQPSAMINFNRVLLNDYIPGTNARLIGVSVHGIGIDIGGARYFVPK